MHTRHTMEANGVQNVNAMYTWQPRVMATPQRTKKQIKPSK